MNRNTLASFWVLINVFLALSVTSCATGYHPIGFTGGYSEKKILKDTFMVSFQGNGWTSQGVARSYLLLRCAELTVQNGFNYFIVMDEQDTSTKSIMGGYHAGNISASELRFPQLTSQIKCYRGKRPEGNNKAYDAREVIANLGSNVER
jgi:hypothetical protein